MKLGLGPTLVIGGARSGKSNLVLELGLSWPGAVCFVATATAGDDDMAARIQRHKDERPARWSGLELPLFGGSDVSNTEGELLIIDCITMLVANLLFEGSSDDEITSHVAELGRALQQRQAPSLAVTNEVGLGVHPETELGRRYRDTLGRANRALADTCQTSLFVVAGKVVRLSDLELEWPTYQPATKENNNVD